MGSTNFENGISQNSLAQIKNSLLYDPLYAQPMPPTTVSYPQPPSLYVVIFDWCIPNGILQEIPIALSMKA